MGVRARVVTGGGRRTPARAYWRSAPLAQVAGLILAALTGAACGDSEDSTPVDAGMDASGGGGGTGGRFSNRRPDAQVLQGDLVPPCDRLDPLACGAGQECEVVVRRSAGEDTFSVYDGCIESRAQTRGEGEPCDPFGGFLVAYSAPGLEDEVFYDPCDVGLYCAPDPHVRNADTCQRSCVSGALACDSPSELCLGPDPFREVCVPSDGCDPLDLTACGVGSGCYLRLGDQGDRVLTVCLGTQPEPIADGEPCTLISDCNPGSSCFGPTRLPPSRWTQADLLCRRTCSPAGSGADDGGTTDGDLDGGAAAGSGCPGGQQCVPFEGSGLSTETIPSAIGQCE